MTATVIPFPGTQTQRQLRSGPEYRWHCPHSGCISNGRWVKRESTAQRQLAKHREDCHEGS